MFIRMFDVQYWKSNNICNTWKIKEKLKILMTCDALPFINTCKPSKKMFQFPGWMRKNFIRGNFSRRVSAETWDASCFKTRSTGKTTECSKHLRHIAIESDIFLELNRYIFQTSLKYIKLVIPKILFVLVLCNFNFYFNITWPLPQQCNPPNIPK